MPEVFTAEYLDRRMREHREWQNDEAQRLSREVVQEVATAIFHHLGGGGRK